MIIVKHNRKKVTSINEAQLSGFGVNSISNDLIKLSDKYPDELIIWVYEVLQTKLNVEELSNIFNRKRMIASYSATKTSYLPSYLGLIDQTPFLNINFEVSYPTFQMNADVGGCYAEVLNQFKNLTHSDFNYFLNSIGKVGQPKGLFCYSEPRLLTDTPKIEPVIAQMSDLFKFVKQHYKPKWTFFLIIALFFYYKKFPVFSFLNSLFKSRRHLKVNDLSSISGEFIGDKKIIVNSIDVIIPTIGRKEYLINVLEDLTQQSWRPKSVIVVEQNPDFSSKSELEDLNNIQWPFKLDLIFTHKAGVCSARNTALSKVTADWVFLADDDNRLQPELLASVKSKIEYFQVNVLNPAYLQLNESEPLKIEKQWETFGAGCSFMASRLLKEVQFDLGFEFGYAEDKDFGAQLRKSGNDILYDPNIKILHLKAPIGGFRFEHSYAWQKEKYTPKPSPTIMLHILKNKTREQFLGFKLVYFLQRLSGWQSILRINSIFKEWNCSLKWATHLKND